MGVRPEGKAVNEHAAPRQSSDADKLTEATSDSIYPKLFPLVELDQQQLDAIVRSVPDGAGNLQDIYPLSPLQEGMLFHKLFNEHSDTYIQSILFEGQSHDQIDLLIDALQKVVNRHDVLRTALLWDALPRAVQVVCRSVVLPVEDLALDACPDPVKKISEMMRSGTEKIDLRQAPLVRLKVARSVDGPRWHAVLQVHHVVCDHQSLQTLVAEVLACLAGQEATLPTPMPYRNHVADMMAERQTRNANAYFSRKFADVVEPTASFGIFNERTENGRIGEARCTLNPILSRKIRLSARRMGLSAARLFHAGWGLVVALVSGSEDVVFGTVVLAARQRNSEAQRMLGMSVNTLPLRLQLSGVTIEEFVRQTHQELVDLLEFEQIPLASIQRHSGIPGGGELFSALFNYRRSASDTLPHGTSAGGIRVLAKGEAWTNYSVAIAVDDLGGDFSLLAQTDPAIDPHQIVAYLETAMQSMVSALEHAPQTPARALAVIPDMQVQQIVESFNSTQMAYPKKNLIHEIFDEQARRRPDMVAAVREGASISYAQLKDRSDLLALYMRDIGVGPDRLVGICAEPSLEMLVAVIAVWKAGAAYVPLDPSYPAERLAYMLEDAAPLMVLTQENLKGRLPRTSATVISLDHEWTKIAQHNTESRAETTDLHSHHLAYAIYTSGSTGQPKGVMIEHRHVLNLWTGLEALYDQVGSCQRVALNASLNFDASVQQIVQLLSGRTVVLVPQRLRRDAGMLLEFFDQQRVECVDCTPSQLRTWLAAGLLEAGRHSLRMVLVGGEAIDTELWSTLARSPEMEFFNVYGPTECTVDVTVARLKDDTTKPHIGRPMTNRRVYILDQYKRPMPAGVSGEIYIGGAGVGRGYLNRDELTFERFIADPFITDDPEARMYRTGDLGRLRADGMLDYLGRNDRQIKLRGYRIELGEIEAQLLRHPWVGQAAVVVRNKAEAQEQLVAYVVPAERTVDVEEPGTEELRRHLQARLPEHMLPSAFVVLERMPLTPSGKLDRRGLPAPGVDAYATQPYEPPHGDIESLLAKIWCELLRVERVGRRQSFFDLGGHSVLAMQVMTRVHASLSLQVPVRLLFESPTIEKLAVQIDQLRRARLLERIKEGGSGIEQLLEQVASMQESQVEDLLQKMTTGVRR